MKTCGTCRIEKPCSEFYVNRARGGFQHCCKSCTKAKVIQWNKQNPAEVAARHARYARKHRAKKAAATAQWYAKNKQRNHANAAAWYSRNPQRGAAKTAAYRAAKMRATPSWANTFFMEEVYDLAALRTKHLGVAHSVDHIVPLKHPLVCGLHVESNLRVIPSTENSAKGNRHWPDMPTLDIGDIVA